MPGLYDIPQELLGQARARPDLSLPDPVASYLGRLLQPNTDLSGLVRSVPSEVPEEGFSAGTFAGPALLGAGTIAKEGIREGITKLPQLNRAVQVGGKTFTGGGSHADILYYNVPDAFKQQAGGKYVTGYVDPTNGRFFSELDIYEIEKFLHGMK